MEKIKEFIGNIFSLHNLFTGLFGIGFGLSLYGLGTLIGRNTFQDIAIFIGVGLGFIFTIFFLGYLLNKTLFKNEN